VVDVESNPQRNEAGKKAPELIRERRQDLCVWLNLTDEEDKTRTSLNEPGPSLCDRWKIGVQATGWTLEGESLSVAH